jgi:hypothetical protein
MIFEGFASFRRIPMREVAMTALAPCVRQIGDATEFGGAGLVATPKAE